MNQCVADNYYTTTSI